MKHSESRNSKGIPARLSSKLERNLWAYATAAGAAGVGMLASSPAAEAKIVYTPAHATVNATLILDLNHDGITDFYLVRGGSASIGGSLRVSYLQVCHNPSQNFDHVCVSSGSSPIADNAVRILSSGAAALPAGAKIANGERFESPGVPALMVRRNFYSGSNTAQKWFGPWANGGKGTNNRYLGFKFKIKDQFHYGWARLTVTTTPHSGFTSTLTGYAYETIPNKGIVAGQTTGTDEVSAMDPTGPFTDAHAGYRPASLGLLGLGAPGLSIWRREEDASN